MGLTSWDKALEGKVVKTDVTVAKNYLQKEELESLGRMVNAYLDLAEDRAKRKIPMTMVDWAKRLDLFLEFDERNILQDSGKITAKYPIFVLRRSIIIRIISYKWLRVIKWSILSIILQLDTRLA